MFLEYSLVLLIIFQPVLNFCYMMALRIMRINFNLTIPQSRIYVESIVKSIDTYLLFMSITLICAIYTCALTVEVLFKAQILPIFWKNSRNSINASNKYVSRGIWSVCLPLLMLNSLLTKIIVKPISPPKIILYFGAMSFCFSVGVYTIAKILRTHIDPEAIITIDSHFFSKSYKPMSPQSSPKRYIIKGSHHGENEINVIHKVTLNTFSSNRFTFQKMIKHLTLTFIKNMKAYLSIIILKLTKLCCYLTFIIIAFVMTYIRLSPQILTVKKFGTWPHYNHVSANATINYEKFAIKNLIINSSYLTISNIKIWPYALITLIWIVLIVWSLKCLSKIMTKHHIKGAGKNHITSIQASFTHGEYIAITIIIYTFITCSLLYLVYWVATNKLFANHPKQFDFQETFQFFMLWVFWHPILLIHMVLVKPYDNIVLTICDIIWPYNNLQDKHLKLNGGKSHLSVKHFLFCFTVVSLICLFTFSSITRCNPITFILKVILARDLNGKISNNLDVYAICKRSCLIIYWFLLTTSAFYFCLKQTQTRSGLNSNPNMQAFKLICRRKCFHAITLAILGPGLMLDFALTSLATVIACVILLEIELLRYTVNNNDKNFQRSKTLRYVMRRFNESYESLLDSKDRQAPFVLSHVYLLLGTSLPIWLAFWAGNQNLGPKPGLAAWAGLLSVALGDSVSAIAGSYAKAKNRFHCPLPYCSTAKSATGCLASFAVQLIALAALKTLFYDDNYHAMDCLPTGFWGKSIMALTLTSLLEGYTGQNDNLVIPICTFYTLTHL